MRRRTRLPAHVVREAGALLAARADMDRLLRGDPDGGPAIKTYLVRLGRAKGISEFVHHVPAAPQMGMGRSLTVCIKSYNGTYRACVLPNTVPRETATTFLDQADGGLLDRERVWGDPRYVGLVSQCFGPDGPNGWWAIDPERGVVARAAWAALILEGLRRDVAARSSVAELEAHLGFNLFEFKRATLDPDGEAAFSGAGDPYAKCWTIGALDEILGVRDTTVLEPPRPPTVPLDLFRHRGDLGYGELIAYWLTRDPQGPGLSQAEAAHAMGLIDRKAASRLATTAKRKLGTKKSLLQLIPPWPAGSQCSSDLRDSAPARPSAETEHRRGGE